MGHRQRRPRPDGRPADASREPELRSIKYYCIDEWRGKKHNRSCKCSSKSSVSIQRRLKGVNTSISEQVFAWFRNYARILNHMSSNHHHFLVLLFCRRHNMLVDRMHVDHLCPFGLHKKAKISKQYSCTRKRPAARA